jgi:hypothetical protein
MNINNRAQQGGTWLIRVGAALCMAQHTNKEVSFKPDCHPQHSPQPGEKLELSKQGSRKTALPSVVEGRIQNDQDLHLFADLGTLVQLLKVSQPQFLHL